MNAPTENLLGPQKRRVALLDLDPPGGTAPPDDEEPLAEPEEEDREDE